MLAMMQVDDSGTGMSPVPFFFFGLVACVLGAASLMWFLRRRAMKRLAEADGLHWLNDGLPGDFPADKLGRLGHWFTWGGWRKSYNVIGGQEGDHYLLAFDIVVGMGRQSYKQTVVAVRGDRARAPLSSVEGMEYFASGRWRIVTARHRWYEGSKIWSTEFIEKVWESLK